MDVSLAIVNSSENLQCIRNGDSLNSSTGWDGIFDALDIRRDFVRTHPLGGCKAEFTWLISCYIVTDHNYSNQGRN